ncbi:MAG: PilZ domain-containing protein [Clostridia bacterium]|nr:PilZ domain-containing protein [Clostridia bacterium]
MERRKFKRFPFTVTLKIEELYKQDNLKIEVKDEIFEVVDLSRSGVGFLCEQDLPLEFYFNAKITINDEKHFYSVVKIIRKTMDVEKFHYGCEFVGLADILSNIVDDLDD